MAIIGQKTEEVYRRHAIVDQAMIREAAIKVGEERRFGELLHNELHNRKGAGRIVEIVRKIDTARWPRG